MINFSAEKPSCATCDCKRLGILKCEGCLQIFCRNHINEHRDMLSQQLDEIVVEHDTLQQMIINKYDQEDNRYSLLNQIDQWEKDSIIKIQQTAEETRQQIRRLFNLQKETFSKELQDIAEQLKKAQFDDDYFETHIRRWTDVLKEIKDNVNTSPEIIIEEDSTKTFVTKIFASTLKQQMKLDDVFGELHGPVRIENNGRLVRHYGEKRSIAFVRGLGVYSSGQHRIQFIASKKPMTLDILFGIVSKRMILPQSWDGLEYSAFGWWTNDETYPRNIGFVPGKHSRDLKGETTFEIELSIDCDNHRISYFNGRTKIQRVLNVDITKCPLPWQLLFNLYNGEDQVRLIRSCENS